MHDLAKCLSNQELLPSAAWGNSIIFITPMHSRFNAFTFLIVSLYDIWLPTHCPVLWYRVDAKWTCRRKESHNKSRDHSLDRSNSSPPLGCHRLNLCPLDMCLCNLITPPLITFHRQLSIHTIHQSCTYFTYNWVSFLILTNKIKNMS